MKLLGIEFAPLLLPWQRRLQTFAVLQWTACFLCLGYICTVINLVLLFTRFYFVPLIYLGWYIYDRKTSEQGGRPVAWVRQWNIWKHFRDYFPMTLIKTSDLDPNKNYILGFHPHGVMSAGAFCNFATEANFFHKRFPGIRPILLTLAGQFSFPLHREYFMTTGACAATKESISWLLTKQGLGNALVLVVGGAAEALEAKPGSLKVNLSRRKGFIKLALKHGASLVPVYSFGENDLFEQVPNPEGSKLRAFQNRMTNILGFSPPLFHGRGVFNYTFGLIPFRRPVHTVVGSPIDVEKIENPSQKQIDSLHAEYIDGLKRLFVEHRSKYGIDETKELEIM